MGRRGRIAGGVGAAIGVATISAGIALGAVQRAILSVEEAPGGAEVTIQVATTARGAQTRPGTLIIVPTAAFDASPSALQCEEIAGSAVVGEMTWQAGPVAFGDGVYDGFIGDAVFTVPDVPAGSYYLAESIAARGTGCHVFAAFDVTPGQLPDTAMTATPLGLRGGQSILVAAVAGSAA